MMRVTAAPEPATFDALVRQPGQTWLAQKAWVGPAAPRKAKIEPYWRLATDDLLSSYDRICSYASLRIPGISGTPSVDHFAPKSRALADIYEWSNYRLACTLLNSRKRNFTNLADPFTLPHEAFVLNPLTGGITPNGAITGAALAVLKATSKRLKLDEAQFRNARLYLIDAYLAGRINAAHLASESPFISYELARQGVHPPAPLP